MPALGVIIKTESNTVLLKTKINFESNPPVETKFLKTWVLSAYRNTQEVNLPNHKIPMAINKYVVKHLESNNDVCFISTELTKANGSVFDDLLVVDS